MDDHEQALSLAKSVADAANNDDETFRRWMSIEPGKAQRIMRIVGEPLIDGLLRLRTYGVGNIPAHGAALLCPNHASYLDPFIHARGLPRIVRFMAKAEVFDWPVAGGIIRRAGGFPVRRGQRDLLAMRMAERLLHDGQLVAVYPEGTTYRASAALGSSKSGPARLVHATGVTVIPVASWGNKPRQFHGRRVWAFPRFTTVYGPAITCDDVREAALEQREAVDIIRERIWNAVHAVYEVAEHLHWQRPSGDEIPDVSTFTWSQA